MTCLIVGAAMCGAAERPLAERFAHPPESARLQAWFHWNGDCVTKEGLAADLKAMGEMEIGTAHVFLPSMAHLPVTAKPLTPAWFELWETAIREAKRNNVKLGFHNCPG
ncbi:MAG: glycosyl hydrolase, partial [bacterium]|nr:glycosyl hydrolase [bacterium]